jgi:hypothetical protein
MTTINAYLTQAPDWAGGIKLSRSWRTRIKASVTGAEQRAGLFSWPRRSLRYQVSLTRPEETARLVQRLWSHLPGVWGVPIWPEQAVLTDHAPETVDVLPVDDASAGGFVVGGRIILLDEGDSDRYEVGTLSVVSAQQLTLTDGLIQSWAKGSLVCPLLAARIQPRQTPRYSTAGGARVNVEAVEAFQ